MRIDGNRASTFTNLEIAKMIGSGCSLCGNTLTKEQKEELKKTLISREGKKQ